MKKHNFIRKLLLCVWIVVIPLLFTQCPGGSGSGGGGDYMLTIAWVGDGNVTVSPESADLTYAEGTVVTLTAEPGDGYRFDSWGGDLSGSTNPETLTMDSDKSVSALFL